MGVMVKSLKSVAVEDLVYVAESDGKVIGTMINIPNINETIYKRDSSLRREMSCLATDEFFDRAYRKTKSLLFRDVFSFYDILRDVKKGDFHSIRTLIMGVSEKSRKKGIEGLMILELYRRAKTNYLYLEKLSGSEIVDINLDMVNELRKIGSLGYEWDVYEKKLAR